MYRPAPLTGTVGCDPTRKSQQGYRKYNARVASFGSQADFRIGIKIQSH